MAQWVQQMTCKQEVASANPAGEQIFFENQFLHTLFLCTCPYLNIGYVYITEFFNQLISNLVSLNSK